MPRENQVHPSKLPRDLVRLIVLLAIAVFINYIDRGNLSIAAPLLKDELGVNPTRLGFLLSAFFWTYAALQPIYGWLVDRLNVYWLFAACFSLWSLATAATGLAHVFAVLVVLRFVLGISEAVIFPANSKIIALNYSEEHRGVANAVVIAGISLGPGLGLLLGGTMMARFGWRAFFVVLGLVSLLWVPAWIRWMPKTKPVASGAAGGPSLWEFLRLRSAWGTCCGLWCGNYANYFLLTWMPYYLVRELHFSMQTMAKIGGSGYLLAAGCAAASGWLADQWIMAGASPTKARKTFAASAPVGVAILLALCPTAPPAVSVVLLLGAMACFGVSSSNIYAISQRLAGPEAAGRWVGFQNGFGNLSGAVVPVVTGLVLERTGHFALAFYITAGFELLAALFWGAVLGPIEPVVWHGGRKGGVGELIGAPAAAEPGD
ncbi:MAG TPA: MFS transporter [Candidatus Bathyarchaeia archaeon]|nr:MFS transporter [Candidatus Bathyarchaeia archaeon]